MIELKIINSSDYDRMGDYSFYMDQIKIGKAVDCNDIFLPHESIEDQHLALEIEDNKLYANPHHDKIHFHVNGKKTTGKKLIKNSDKITIGSTSLELISFSKEVLKPKKEYLNMRVQQLQDEESELISILQNLSKDETEL